jgi:hypothetical protein
MFKTKEEPVLHMKKAKFTLGLVAGLVATMGLASCNETTYNEGVVLTYTDSQGNRVDYTAAELFSNYQKGSSAASTDFEKVYELLIRKYYAQASQATALAAINKTAQADVNSVKETAEKNASTNGTSYETEFEKLLTSNNCENVDELFDLKQYNAEKTKFEKDYYVDNMDNIRDGVDSTGAAFFPASTTYGVGSSGYLKERMPYHVRHILVKTTAANNELTEATISEANAKKIGTVVEELAGDNGATQATRTDFGNIALTSSDDTSSGALYGDLGVMDKTTGFVNEFQLGVYAYDALYNQSTSDYRTATKAAITAPDTIKVLDGGTEKTVKDFFIAGETDDSGASTGIGQIPYGAAVALIKAAAQDGSSLESKPNKGSEVYYPRNVLFNKYFNKHNICVITPNDISYNSSTSSTFSKETFDGTLNATYAALPGFKVDTTNILPGFKNNVLTDSQGQIVLVVRAGTTGSNTYEGIHFITIQRSAFEQYGHYLDTATNQYKEYTTDQSTASDTPTISEYYTTKVPTDDGYPTYTPTSGTATKMTTYVNFIKQTSDSYKKRRDDFVSRIKGYNANISTYMFQSLIESQKITFANKTIGDTIASYIKEKREKTNSDDWTTWENSWRTYAEYLINQNAQRAKGVTTGKGPLISETCAIGYTSSDAQNATGDWAVGGICYGK